MSEIAEVVGGDVRAAAFRRLLQTGAAVAVSELAADLGRPTGEIGAVVDELSQGGRIRIDEQSRVVGASGLSVVPDRHEIDIGGRRFWTWCTYDILGIFGALRATGLARTTDPDSGASLEVRFDDGRPVLANLFLFRPDEGELDCCTNVYEQWCPNSNLFESREAALAWSAARGLNGRVLALADAAPRLAAPGRWPA